MKVDKIISYILLISIIVAVAAVVYIIVNPSPGEKFTEFYILGPDGKAGNYPTNLSLNQSGNLTIGIVNHEGVSTSYRLVVRLDNQTLNDEKFNLKDQEKKEIPFTFSADQIGDGQKLEFLLYKLPNDQKPYRYLDLLINVA